MSKHVHVVKKAGFLINDGYIEKLLKSKPNYLGIARPMDDHIENAAGKPDEGVTKELIKSIQEQLKDTTAVFTFGDATNVLDEDMQPIPVLKDDEGRSLCVAILDGDFERHKPSNETHTSEFIVAQNILAKKIQKWFTKGGSIDAVIEELEDDLTKQDIQNLWNSRGVITFMFADGRVVTIQAGNEAAGQYSWGFASNGMGYLENVGDNVKKTEPEKKLSPFQKMMGSLGSKKTETAPAPQNGTVVSQATQPPKTETATKAPQNGILIRPDLKVYDTRKKIAKYYEDRLGHKPMNFRNGPPLWETTDSTGKKVYSLAEKTMASIQSALVDKGQTRESPLLEPVEQGPEKTVEVPPASDNKASAMSLLAGGKRVTSPTAQAIASKALPAGTTESVSRGVTTKALPVLSPTIKTKVEAILKKPEFHAIVSADTLKTILDPKELRAMSKELPTFMEGFGLPNDRILAMPYEFHLEVARDGGPEAAAKLSFDLVRTIIGLQSQVKAMSAKLAGDTRQAM